MTNRIWRSVTSVLLISCFVLFIEKTRRNLNLPFLCLCYFLFCLREMTSKTFSGPVPLFSSSFDYFHFFQIVRRLLGGPMALSFISIVYLCLLVQMGVLRKQWCEWLAGPCNEFSSQAHLGFNVTLLSAYLVFSGFEGHALCAKGPLGGHAALGLPGTRKGASWTDSHGCVSGGYVCR